jgi:hypothetical protein
MTQNTFLPLNMQRGEPGTTNEKKMVGVLMHRFILIIFERWVFSGLSKRGKQTAI